MLVAGAILCFAVAMYIVVATIGLWQRLQRQRVADRQTAKLLELKIAAASETRKTVVYGRHHWNGVRKFVVQRRVEESHDTASFYLKPHDGRPLPMFLAGQFLTFRFHITGEDRPVVRCYSLSNAPNSEVYRITVRRMGEGLASNFIHDNLGEGDILDVMAPRGDFCIEPGHHRPSVLIGGGVGITPVLSMLHSIAETGTGAETWLIHGIRSPQDRVMASELQQLKEQNESFRVRIGYSAETNPPEAADFSGRVTVDYLKRILPSNNYEFFICGSPAMMHSLVADLNKWGVPSSSIHTEAFGTDSVTSVRTAMPNDSEDETERPDENAAVEFARSARSATWKQELGTLLELAEANDVCIDAGCRAGSCGSCMTAVRKGEVTYLEKPGFPCEDGSCLPCICVPKGQLALDA